MSASALHNRIRPARHVAGNLAESVWIQCRNKLFAGLTTADKNMKSDIKELFRRKILRWYKKNRRPLPWRRNPTAYRVWISEIMLQQTQSQTVIPYYNRFLEHFPDIADLAQAREEDVLALWSGLGYYRRARNIHKAAREIVRYYDGTFPSDYQAIRSLPGIGPYTAGAICSIAFNQPKPVVDGNIRRVLARLNGLTERTPDRYFWDWMASCVPRKDPSLFNQGIMELGALVCLPRQPLCPQCPVRSLCKAASLGLQKAIPPAGPRHAAEKVELSLLVLTKRGKTLLVRQEDGFIPGVWGFPYATVSVGRSFRSAAEELNRKLAGKNLRTDYKGEIRHSITHRRITIHVFAGESTEDSILLRNFRRRAYWATDAQLRRMVTSSLFRKVLLRVRE